MPKVCLNSDEILRQNKEKAHFVAQDVCRIIINTAGCDGIMISWLSTMNNHFLIQFHFLKDYAIAVSIPVTVHTTAQYYADLAIMHNDRHIRPASIGYHDVKRVYGEKDIRDEVVRLRDLFKTHQIPTS